MSSLSHASLYVCGVHWCCGHHTGVSSFDVTVEVADEHLAACLAYLPYDRVHGFLNPNHLLRPVVKVVSIGLAPVPLQWQKVTTLQLHSHSQNAVFLFSLMCFVCSGSPIWHVLVFWFRFFAFTFLPCPGSTMCKKKWRVVCAVIALLCASGCPWQADLSAFG